MGVGRARWASHRGDIPGKKVVEVLLTRRLFGNCLSMNFHWSRFWMLKLCVEANCGCHGYNLLFPKLFLEILGNNLVRFDKQLQAICQSGIPSFTKLMSILLLVTLFLGCEFVGTGKYCWLRLRMTPQFACKTQRFCGNETGSPISSNSYDFCGPIGPDRIHCDPIIWCQQSRSCCMVPAV